MKYYVFETTMKPNGYKNPNFRTALAGHMDFVKSQYAEGIILFSGTKPDNSGGVRVIKISDDADISAYWKLDPMVQAELLDYRVTAFTPLDVSEPDKAWFEI